jgi:hypothetical protein
MSLRLRFLAALCAVATAALPAYAQSKAHTHGLATLNIVIEGRTGMLEFSAPAEDLYGFERAPRNAAERERRDAALNRLRRGMGELVIFDGSLGCTITATEVRDAHDAHGHDHGKAGDDHADVRGEYAIACQRPPAGKEIRFGFSKAFPAIKTVQVQLLADDRQDGRRIENDRGTVRP